MELHDKYKALVELLIEVNHANRARMLDEYNHADRVKWLRDVGTVAVDVGQRIGRAQLIVANAVPQDIVITSNPNVNYYSECRAYMVSLDDVRQGLVTLDLNHSVRRVWVDMATWMFRDREDREEFLYGKFSFHRDQTFVLLG